MTYISGPAILHCQTNFHHLRRWQPVSSFSKSLLLLVHFTFQVTKEDGGEGCSGWTFFHRVQFQGSTKCINYRLWKKRKTKFLYMGLPLLSKELRLICRAKSTMSWMQSYSLFILSNHYTSFWEKAVSSNAIWEYKTQEDVSPTVRCNFFWNTILLILLQQSAI